MQLSIPLRLALLIIELSPAGTATVDQLVCKGRIQPCLQQTSVQTVAAKIMEELHSDTQADIVQEMEAENSEAILAEMKSESADNVRKLSQYEADTAGGLMNIDQVTPMTILLHFLYQEELPYMKNNSLGIPWMQQDHLCKVDKE